MIQTIPVSSERKAPVGALIALLLLAALGGWLYFHLAARPAPETVFAATTGAGGLSFSYEVITSDLEVDWAGGPPFDPRDKCPRDFFTGGFVLICKKLADGAYFRFLYHKGKRLLFRIDQDLIEGQRRIGLHWVESTRYNARYRIADEAFAGGKKVPVPNARGGTNPVTFEYGQAVSKKKVQPGRELFHPTHLTPEQCPEWWDIINFIP